MGQTWDLIEVNLDPLDPEHPGISHEFVPVNELMAEAAGVAVADVNNDGFDDLFFGSTEGLPNELYLNNGDATFTESAFILGVDEPAKRRSHGLFFDYDNDGDLDLVTLGYPGDLGGYFDLYSFFRNDGAPGFGFTDVTGSVGGFALGATTETTEWGNPGGAAVADYNNDGYLDFITTYWMRNTPTCCFDSDQFRLWKSVPNPNPDLGEPDYSPRLFVDATLEAGLDGLGDGWTWSPIFEDVDRDGWVDLHINIEAEQDLLLLNQKDGTFGPNIATPVGRNFNGPEPLPGGAWGHEMGAGVGDFDNDFDLDWYLTNTGSALGLAHKEDAFYRNDSDLSLGGVGQSYHHIGAEADVTNTVLGVGWGAIFVDIDNDCDRDLLTARGMGNVAMLPMGYSTNGVYRNLFPATDGNGNIEWEPMGVDVPGFSREGGQPDTMRSLAAIDYDNDGDLDLVATKSGGIPVDPADEMGSGFYKSTLVEESTDSVNALQVALIEAGGSLNTIGARVFTRIDGPGGLVQMGEVRTGSSFLNQESSRLHFGLADSVEADWVAVRWTDGAVTVLKAADHDLNGIVTVSRDLAGATSLGDVDGDGDQDCNDLARLTDAVQNGVLPDQGDWAWEVTADLDGNHVLDGRDFENLRLIVPDPLCVVSGALEGVAGKPTLRGFANLAGGTAASFELDLAAPNALTFMVIGLGTPYAPVKGGLLVPTADFVLGPFVSDGNGELTLAGTWPNGIPADTLINFQMLINDVVAIHKWSMTNGVSARTP